jgi:hypothetical protein
MMVAEVTSAKSVLCVSAGEGRSLWGSCDSYELAWLGSVMALELSRNVRAPVSFEWKSHPFQSHHYELAVSRLV